MSDYLRLVSMSVTAPKKSATAREKVSAHPFNAMAKQMLASQEAWGVESGKLRAVVEPMASDMSEINASLKTIVEFMAATGKWLKRLGPPLILAGGAAIGATPALTKAIIAAWTGG